MSNGLILLDGDNEIEADGYLTLAFSVKLDSEYAEASKDEVLMAITIMILDGDFQKVSGEHYRITGP